jgi:hypothetical protein
LRPGKLIPPACARREKNGDGQRDETEWFVGPIVQSQRIPVKHRPAGHE